MNKPTVSIVIPVYNVEQYLNRCVDSVINQTLKDIEIILVDDGSPDNSPQICDQYQSQDSRIKVIHKTNGGLASARNAGMKEATGKYLFFLDSDDWLELDGMEHIVNLMNQYDVDFVRYRAIRSYWPGLEEHAPCMVEDVREMNGGLYDSSRIKNEVLPRLFATSQLSMGPIVGAWGSLYKRNLLIENNIYFDEDVKFSEDMIFSAKVVLATNSFYYDDNPCVYHYFYNANSISKSFRKNRWDSCKALVKLFDSNFKNYNQYDFSNQLNYVRWFCILLGLNEKNYLTDIKEKELYCKSIINDEVVKETELKLSILNVSFKLKLMLILIKLKQYKLLARI